MLQIIWDKQARDAWQEIADDCRTFGPKSVEKFASNVQSWVIAIAQNPGIGKKEPLLKEYAEKFYEGRNLEEEYRKYPENGRPEMNCMCGKGELHDEEYPLLSCDFSS